jgi:hypothetical protein
MDTIVPSFADVEKNGLKRPSRFSVIITKASEPELPFEHPVSVIADDRQITMHRSIQMILLVIVSPLYFSKRI